MNFEKLKIEAAINVWNRFYKYSYPIFYREIFNVFESQSWIVDKLKKRYSDDIEEYTHGLKEKVIKENENSFKEVDRFLLPDYPFKEFQFQTGWIEIQSDGTEIRKIIEKNEFKRESSSKYLSSKIHDMVTNELNKEYFKTVLERPDFEFKGKTSEVDNWIFVPNSEPGEGKDERSQYIKDQFYEVVEYMSQANLRKPRFTSKLSINLIEQVYPFSPVFDDIDVLANFREPNDPVHREDFEFFFQEVLNTGEKLSNIEIRKVFYEALYGIAHKKAADYKNVPGVPNLHWVENRWNELLNSELISGPKNIMAPSKLSQLFKSDEIYEKCISILKNVSPPILNDQGIYIGKDKGAFNVWITILFELSLIKFCADKGVYSKLVSETFTPVSKRTMQKTQEENPRPWAKYEQHMRTLAKEISKQKTANSA